MPTLPQPACDVIATFTDLVPGVPANEANLDKILWCIDSAEDELQIETDVGHVALVSSSYFGKVGISACIYTPETYPDAFVCCKSYPKTTQGLMDLLLELRELHKLIRLGVCEVCRGGMGLGLKLLDGQCVTCVLAKFLKPQDS